jgi:virginiamycin B lyase
VLGAAFAAALVPLPAGAATPSPSASPTVAPTPDTAPPPSGAGSITRLKLGGANEVVTRCLARTADGAVWALIAGPRYRLVRVGTDQSVSSFALPGPGASPGLVNQCMAVSSDGGIWLAGTDPTSVVRFDPATHATRRLATPTAAARPTEIAASPDGTVWFDESAPHNVAHVDAAGRVTEYALPGANFGPYTLTVTPDGHVWAGANGGSATDPATGNTVRESIFELDARGTVLHQLAAAQSVVGAISIGLHVYAVAAGPGARPYFSWGPYPYGLGVVQPGPSVKQIGWPVGDIPSVLARGDDDRLWFVVPPTLNYGYFDPKTQAVRAFHAPKGVQPAGLTAGPGGSMSFTADDAFLYRVETGVASGNAPLATVAPSSTATSLPTPARAFGNAAVVVTSVALAVGGTLFITFPAQLFNLTFQENYPTIAAWLARRRGRRRGRAATPRRRRLTFAAVIAVGALFGALLDPGFGRSWSSATSWLATALALLAAASVIGAVTSVYHRRAGHPERPYPLALPLGLAVAAACVLVSRLASFQPGYLYGVVCVFAFRRTLTTREQGHVATVSTLTTLVVSVIAWLLWLPVSHAATQPGAWFGAVLVDDFLAAIFVSGLVGSAIGLLPLRFLAGGAIRQWRPVVWASLFSLAMFGVIDVLLRSPVSPGAGHAPLLTTVVLFVVFGGVAVAFREYFARRWRAEHGVTVRGFRAWARDLLSSHVAPTPR